MSINWINVIDNMTPIEVEYILELSLDKVSKIPEEKRSSLLARVFCGSNMRMVKKGVQNAISKQGSTTITRSSAMRDVRSAF